MRLILAFLLSLLPCAVLAAPDRIALVIGMAKYQTVVQLDNTVNDANAIADTLKKIGFAVTEITDAGGDDMRAALEEFAFRAETADLALVYYAGHGVEVSGENFLIPVDAKVTSNKDVQRQAVSLKQVLASVEGARKMRIVILDSCRNNPFGDALDTVALQQTQAQTEATRSARGGGLAPPSPDRGTLVAFAASDGAVALDGAGKNSPFAQALVDNLPQPNLEISLMFRQIRDDVLQTTGNRQEPHTYGSLSGTPFYLAGGTSQQITDDNPQVAWSGIDPEQELRVAALADQGDTRSMVGLAYMRLNEQDPRYSPETAASLLQRAADAGSAEAQFRLAQLYEKGKGVPKDAAKALALYQASAAQDYPNALNDLGVLYFNGELGLPQDQAKGLAYFEKAANLRQKEAMFNYAAMIDDGQIAGKTPADAAQYLYMSLRSGSRDVLELVQSQPKMFKPETRKALQQILTEKGFYSGPIDGDFGGGTQTAIAAAFGIS